MIIDNFNKENVEKSKHCRYEKDSIIVNSRKFNFEMLNVVLVFINKNGVLKKVK